MHDDDEHGPKAGWCHNGRISELQGRRLDYQGTTPDFLVGGKAGIECQKDRIVYLRGSGCCCRILPKGKAVPCIPVMWGVLGWAEGKPCGGVRVHNCSELERFAPLKVLPSYDLQSLGWIQPSAPPPHPKAYPSSPTYVQYDVPKFATSYFVAKGRWGFVCPACSSSNP